LQNWQQWNSHPLYIHTRRQTKWRSFCGVGLRGRLENCNQKRQRNNGAQICG
ncbi:hypothetical protein M9458_041883, partial [Cirrhinus mrigala]